MTTCWTLDHVFQITPVGGIIICSPETKAELRHHKCQAAELTVVEAGVRTKSRKME